MFASSSSDTARPSLLHRALRTAVAFATLEAVVLEPGESAAECGAGPSGAAPSRSTAEHPHRRSLEPRLQRRPGRVAPAPQVCVLGSSQRSAGREARGCRAAAGA